MFPLSTIQSGGSDGQSSPQICMYHFSKAAKHMLSCRPALFSDDFGLRSAYKASAIFQGQS